MNNQGTTNKVQNRYNGRDPLKESEIIICRFHLAQLVKSLIVE